MEEYKAPVAKKVLNKISCHGHVRTDDYSWMQDSEDPDLTDYIEKESSYLRGIRAGLRGLEDKLFSEMKSRIKENDISPPVRMDGYYYYKKMEKGKQHPVFCRRKDNMESPEEILLDLNDLSRRSSFFTLGIFEVSPDKKKLAYSTNYDGSENYTIRIKDLVTGEMLADEIKNTTYSFEWMNDSLSFVYSKLDDIFRPYKVYHHILETDHKDDTLIYHETDEHFHLFLKKSRSSEYIFIELCSQMTTEIYYLRASSPDDLSIGLINKRESKHEYFAYHNSNSFLILTNDGAHNFKLVKAPVTSPGKENWTEIISHRDDVEISHIDVFENYIVLYEITDGLTRPRVLNLISGSDYYIDIPDLVYGIEVPSDLPMNAEYRTDTFRFMYSSFKTPCITLDLNMQTRETTLVKADEILGGYNAAEYSMERLYADTTDGKKVPISMVYKKGMKRDGKNPMLLYGYGAYGYVIEPNFSSSLKSLLDRGFIFAIAHIRGGGAKGFHWHDDGRLFKKMNTFTDFISCAEHLIDKGYTAKDKLVIYGASAGGLLIGAVINMRPDLFKAAIAAVPFINVIDVMLDPGLPLTVTEYEEWGNPEEKLFYDYMLTYSPYDNVKAQPYPRLMVITGINDPRVPYWESLKWVAKLRANKTDKNLLILQVEEDAGHNPASGRYDYLRKVAFNYAFMLDSVNMKE